MSYRVAQFFNRPTADRAEFEAWLNEQEGRVVGAFYVGDLGTAVILDDARWFRACDGEHSGPACRDRDCWQLDPDAAPVWHSCPLADCDEKRQHIHDGDDVITGDL